MVGMFAASKAGHDKNQLYIILKEDKEYVYLVDGKYKTVENPKKKNKKHIQPIKHFVELAEPIRNEEIKRTIKIYKNGNMMRR